MMFQYLATIDPTAVIVAILGVFGGGLVTRLLFFRPERDAIIVKQAEGAATIYTGLTQALQAELSRKDVIIAAREAENEELRKRVHALEQENAGIRLRYGTRSSDPEEDASPEADAGATST